MTENKTSKGMNIHGRRAIAYIVLGIMTFLCLVWFYILFINATRSHAELTKGFTPLPSTHLIDNFNNLLAGTLPVIRGMLNSLFVSVACAALCTYFSTMTAYAVHVYDFAGKKFISTFILAVMMIPTQVTVLGFLQLIGKMGLDDSYVPLIVPLPLSLVESARIDGANEFYTFNKIVLPLMKPAISVQAIFTFVSNWNNYFTPALILHTDTKKTLPILIAQLRSADWLKFDMGQVYVMIAFSIFPVIVVYLILSKYIVGGVAVGAVKG